MRAAQFIGSASAPPINQARHRSQMNAGRAGEVEGRVHGLRGIRAGEHRRLVEYSDWYGHFAK